MISEETMRCRKVRRIRQYHVPKKLLSQEKFAHHVLLLFYLFRDEKEMLSGFPPTYQNKLQEEGVQDVVNISKMKVDPYDCLVDQALQFNENLINKHTHIAKLKMMKHQGKNIPIKVIQKKKQKKTSAHPNSCHKYCQMMKSQKV